MTQMMNHKEFWDARRTLRQQREQVIERMLLEGFHTHQHIADTAGVSAKTVQRRLHKHKNDNPQ